MKVTVFGATGGTGRHLVRLALDRGHEVTAVARNPQGPAVRSPGLTVLRGDLTRPGDLRAAVEGRDAVLCAVGAPYRFRATTTLHSAGVGLNLVTAMRAAGVRRLICITSMGVDPGPELPIRDRLMVGFVTKVLIPAVYADMALLERTLRTTEDLDWTAVRAPKLSDGPATGQYVNAVGGHLGRTGGRRPMPRADLASYMIELLADERTFGHWVEVAPKN
ncbi:hypothetical protein DP939_34650 [Spongiactinospora rosea]|uniref:NAD(P)-binding domain-containing protein n=1 Tax=Spongiactinospora rosea TaxID=2248750 RepID=A0A366LNN1_9ACTN|nr:NAD(P)H-binding protein [Spongiactinospora rosea]RBQ15521.1 hypothetical protein DP939_34650 [Spongiactinospora rosea]